jgi:hypothetical protein
MADVTTNTAPPDASDQCPLKPGELRVIEWKPLGGCKYEVTTESLEYGRVTQNVYTFPDSMFPGHKKSVAVTGGDVEPPTVDTTEDDLRRVESLDREATPGPWSWEGAVLAKDKSKVADYRWLFGPDREQVLWLASTEPTVSDAYLIAEFRSLSPRLAASLRAARSRIAEVEGERDAAKQRVKDVDKQMIGILALETTRLQNERKVALSERDTARAELAAMTKDRDEWRSAASDGLSVIRSLKTDALAADGRTGEVPGDVREAAEEFMDYENDSSVSPTPVWAPGEIVARFVLSLKTAPPAAPDPTATNGG